MVETYKKIEGFELYSVSDLGNVKNDTTGKILKGRDQAGYLRVCLYKHNKQHDKFTHRLIAEAFLLNPENKKCVDHVDNNKHNNNLINLRYATHSQNQHNRLINKNNTSGTKGVYWKKSTNKWNAQICINGKTISLGSFINKEDAINIRIQRAKDEFGEYINKCELVINV